MKIWVTSDLHFSHKNIIKFCPTTRGHYSDVDHMNSDMIRMWNEKVQPDDLVYIMGDIAFCSAQDAAKIVRSLAGNKILITGNHDSKLVQQKVFTSCFRNIYQYHELRHNGMFIVMFHFPIFDHNQAGRGSVMLHGHRHGNPHNLPGRIMDVGFDATGEIVVGLDDILEKMKKIDFITHHRPGEA